MLRFSSFVVVLLMAARCAAQPLGWNSWLAYGATVTEQEVRANADYMAENLLGHGYEYVVVDIRWTVQNEFPNYYNEINPVFTLDANGRFLPAPNRFPSAAGGLGFKPLADYIHSKGLKFGLHIMRGIPKVAYQANVPIAGSNYSTGAVSVAPTCAECQWLHDMHGVERTAAGQAYYNSLFDLYAGWGVDFVKMDDSSLLNTPLGDLYYKDEIEMVRSALDQSGRPMVLSLSPGPPPGGWVSHASQQSNMWRITPDFWDTWSQLYDTFGQFNFWNFIRSEGHYLDGDLLPVGRIAIRSHRLDLGSDRMTHLTHDEQKTMMSLWSIARSPLMIGGDLPSNDQFTLDLLTNDEVLAVNQHSDGNAPLFQNANSAAWKADAQFGKYVGLFSFVGGNVSVSLSSLGLSGPVRVRDLWTHSELSVSVNTVSANLPAHGGTLYLVRPFIPGDFNANGEVDAADYTVWRNSVGKSVPNFTGADADGNGLVSGNDYLLWKQYYSQFGGAGVPEPATVVHLLAVSMLFLARARRPRPR